MGPEIKKKYDMAVMCSLWECLDTNDVCAAVNVLRRLIV